MTQKRAGRTGCNQATLRAIKCTPDYTGITFRIKAVLIRPLLWEGSCRGGRSVYPSVRAVT